MCAPAVKDFIASSPSPLRSPEASRPRRTALAAERESETSPEEPGGEAPKYVAPIFQELNCSNDNAKGLMRAMVGAFNSGQRAVDIVLLDPRQKATLMYALATLPDAFEASAQILIRRRDRRFRMRVAQKFLPQQDVDPEVLRISGGTNLTNMGNAVRRHFVDPVGNNKDARTVQLEFQGKACAENALLVIENAARTSWRELVFHAGFKDTSTEEKQSVSIVVTINTI